LEWRGGIEGEVLIRARFFANHRERLGTDRLEVILDDGATVADLVELLAREHPVLQSALRNARFAVNREYLPPSTSLQPGDEVAFIPPVAGGGSRW
jgi:molybdopterin synthase catalytic subunit